MSEYCHGFLKHRSILAGLFCLMSVSITGCEKNLESRRLYPVRGRVTMDGEPLPFAVLTFQEVLDTEKVFIPRSICVADEKGAFAPWVRKEGDGLPAGQYQVGIVAKNPVINDSVSKTNGTEASAIEFVPAHYSNPIQSGIVVEVTTAGKMVPEVISLTSVQEQ